MKKISDRDLINLYQKNLSVWKVAEISGISGQQVHQRLKGLGINMEGSGKRWTSEDEKKLKSLYQNGFVRGDGKLNEFCKKHNRTKQFVCRKAKDLGLTDEKRKLSDRMRKEVSLRAKKHIEENGHNRGALGMKHTQETKDALSKSSLKMWESFSEDRRSEIIMKQIKVRHKNGTLYKEKKASWKSGWRNIGGKDKYYRSRWEANYARYLEWLKQNGEIKEWEHEPETFWFENIKRGTRSYLPDFRVKEKNGDIEYHEVKGWMDDRSKTKIKRMAKYYPDVKLIIIQKKEYDEIKNKMSRLIDGWE